MMHSSRSRQEEASGPIISPPEHTQEKPPGVLRHWPPLHTCRGHEYFCTYFYYFLHCPARDTRPRRCSCGRRRAACSLWSSCRRRSLGHEVSKQHRIAFLQSSTLRVDADVVAASVVVSALVHVLAGQASVCLGEAQVADTLVDCRHIVDIE